jgi:rhodanese-related sulfurtransferase
MDAQGMFLRKTILLVITLHFSIAASALDSEISGYCVADREYVAQPGSYSDISYNSSVDFSCLTDLRSLSDGLTRYQLVDTRSHLSASEKISGAWHMSVQQLRSIPALAHRHLLLVADGFSRVEAAEACAGLKASGFTNIKFLIEGAPAWRVHHQPRYLNTRDATPIISARQLIYEYFNGQVILVPSSQNVADGLSELGFSDDQYLIGSQSLEEIVADYSRGGYYPVVYIGDGLNSANVRNDHFMNLYILEGGISAIADEIVKSRWINARRGSVHRGSHCG